jgi:hypothetical protein
VASCPNFPVTGSRKKIPVEVAPDTAVWLRVVRRAEVVAESVDEATQLVPFQTRICPKVAEVGKLLEAPED